MRCPYCQSKNIEWVEVKGQGTVYSYTVVRQALLPEFANRIPFVLALITLDTVPGIHFVTNLVDCSLEEVHIGMPVEVVFQKVSEAITVPVFKPRSESQSSTK